MSPHSKIKQLFVLIPSLIRKMGKRRAKDIIRHRVDLTSSSEGDNSDGDTPSNAPPRSENVRHVAYNFEDDSQSRRTSYISVPVSPNKRARFSPLPSGLATPADDDQPDTQEELDMMYLYHRIEHLDLELETETERRKRTAGVR